MQEEADVNTGASGGAGTAKKSIIQNVVDQLNAGKTVEEVREGQKAKAAPKKKAAAPAKKKPVAKKPVAKAPPKKTAVQEKEEAKAEAAQEAEAEEIIN